MAFLTFNVFTLLSLLSLIDTTLSASASDWRSRSIYQVFTDRFARSDGSTTYACNPATNIYCGGSWKGVEQKLDYIKDMGFTAIWISPVTAQVDEAYHGYYQTSLYELNLKFGTIGDLTALAAAVHARGMYLMVDVVPNHMGWAGCHDTVDYKKFHLFDDAEYYHPFCPLENLKNQTEAEVCWLGNCNITMPDLKTDHPVVADEMNRWIKSLVSNYSIDGLRIDSVKNVNRDFFPPWCKSAGVFCMGEVSEGEANYTYPYQQYMDSVLNYPLYYAITRVFQQKSNMSDLVVNLAACTENKEAGCKDSTLLGTFFENHDNPRFAFGTKDLSLVKNALVFSILSDGIPIIYQGQEQHLAGGDDPGCREALWLTGYNTTAPLYKHIAYLNQIRNWSLGKSPSYLTWQTRVLGYTSDTIQLRKDIVRIVLSNQGEARGTYTLVASGMQFTGGEKVIEILSCSEYTANGNGDLDVRMKGGVPSVLVPGKELEGSGMCGF